MARPACAQAVAQGECIRGRVQSPLDHLSIKSHDNEIVRRQLFVWNPARLDDAQPLLAVYTAYISPREGHETVFWQQEIGIQHTLFQRLQHRMFPFPKSRPQRQDVPV